MGLTSLHCAAGKGHTEVASLLLDKGADIEATDRVQQFPLKYHSVAISYTTTSHHSYLNLYMTIVWSDTFPLGCWEGSHRDRVSVTG